MKRLFTGIGVFAELAALAMIGVAVVAGDFAQNIGALVYILGLLAAVAVAAAWSLPLQWLSRMLATGALVIGSIVFSFPFVWMLSTSFKFPEEIFVYPPRWIPAIPEPVRVSPYVTSEELPDITPPETLSPQRWETLWPRIDTALWAQALDLLDLRAAAELDQRALRDAMTRALWSSATAGLPLATWERDDDQVLQAITERLGVDRVREAWRMIYRGVALRPPTVRDRGLVDHQLDGLDDETKMPVHARWQAEGDALIRISAEPVIGGSEGAGGGELSFAPVAYDLTDAAEGTLIGDFPLPIADHEWLAVTLPIRQDRSWHRLHVEIEAQGVRYVLRDRLYLGQRRWQELTFKFAHQDERDERDLGVWPIVAAATMDGSAFNEPGRFRVRLRIERSSRLGQVWHKYVDNYRQAFIVTPHRWRYVFNSLYLVVLSIVGQIVACSMVAYAFARLRWPGRDALFVVLLATMMLPPQVTMIPVFMIFRGLGWYNTLLPLWVPSFLGSAFFIFLLRQFMRAIPNELEDAARIDGCGFFGIYWRIILPLMKPALAAVGIFTFMGVWNEFMGPLIYLNDQRLYPLALGLFDFRSEHGGDFGLLMAASTLMTLPVVGLFFLAQRYFIQGVTLTGLKG